MNTAEQQFKSQIAHLKGREKSAGALPGTPAAGPIGSRCPVSTAAFSRGRSERVSRVVTTRSCASLFRAAGAAGNGKAGQGATRQSEGLLRIRGRARLRTPGPAPSGVPGPAIPCGKALAAEFGQSRERRLPVEGGEATSDSRSILNHVLSRCPSRRRCERRLRFESFADIPKLLRHRQPGRSARNRLVACS